MDIYIRYWNGKTGLVCTRYFNLQFLHRPNPNNLVDVLNEISEIFPKKNWTNLWTDGPSTNWAVLSSIQNQRQESGVPALMNLQSNGLHIIPGAF